MPYYIYRISAGSQLELVESYEAYRDAKQAATAMRATQDPNDAYTVKIVFAQDPTEARQLLTTRRERQPSEDD
jgi:hypothetical protein